MEVESAIKSDVFVTTAAQLENVFVPARETLLAEGCEITLIPSIHRYGYAGRETTVQKLSYEAPDGDSLARFNAEVAKRRRTYYREKGLLMNIPGGK